MISGRNPFLALNFEPYNSGSFNPSFTSRSVKLVDSNYRKHQIFIEPGFPQHGIYAFSVQIVRTEHSRISIGVALQHGDVQRPEFAQYWRLDCETSEVRVRDFPIFEPKEDDDEEITQRRLRQGSIVGVLLDMDTKTVEFAVNGNTVGKPVKLEMNEGEALENLRAACSLIEEGDMLELLDLKIPSVQALRDTSSTD